jgi:integrase
MFPTVTGGLLKYKFFASKVWAPTLKAAKVVFRKFHSTRHSYAAWMLSSRADVRFVTDQLGHSKVTLTMDVYGKHIVSDRHDNVVAALDKYLFAE